MPPQSRFFELWLGTLNDLAKISFEHGARLQSRQLELLMAMQIRLAESQARQVIDFWSRFWRSAATTLPAARAGRGGPSPT
jgi:hypothetical protein